MWTISIETGLHKGITHELKPGITYLGSGEQADLLLLDEGVPELLIQWQLDENGSLTSLATAEGLQFSYDGVTWTQVRAESLFSVNQQYRFEGSSGRLELRLMRAALSDQSEMSTELDADSGTDLESDFSVDLKGTQKTKLPRWLYVTAGFSICSLLAAFWYVAGGTGSTSNSLSTNLFSPTGHGVRGGEGSIGDTGTKRDGLSLSYQLSIGHQAPPDFEQRDIFDKPIASKSLTDKALASDSIASAGSDEPEAASTLKASYTLTMGRPIMAADKLAEPAVYMLQERLEKYGWGKRVVINASGRNLNARATLSESERKEFEKVTQQLIREHGNTIAFRALVEPLEPPTQLLVKQVLGGSSPVVILEDGSRLMQGSVYDGKLVESISTDRIVLRGKDRVEIPI